MNESNVEIGNKLEERVSSVYQALGYSVERNHEVSGAQIDLIAVKRIAGSGMIRLAIEVKSRKGGNITPEIVRDFKNVVSSMQDSINSAVMVTDFGYTTAARAVIANMPLVKLYTIRELENEVFGYAEAMHHYLEHYKVEPESQYYIPIQGWASSRKPISDVVTHIVQWCYKRDYPLPLLVSGDFGAGKTTVLKRVAFSVLQDRQIGKSNLFPLVLELRHLLSYKHSQQDIFTFAAKVFSDFNGQPPSHSRIQREYEGGKLVILLDGFDEINTSATPKEKASYIELLAPVLSGASPCVVTTRSTYFESFEEMRMTLLRTGNPLRSIHRSEETEIIRQSLHRLGVNTRQTFEIPHEDRSISLRPLDTAQVHQYIVARAAEIKAELGISIEDFEARIYRIYSISDLARRPLLLRIIVDTCLLGGFAKMEGQEFNAAKLYQRYTYISASRDEVNRPDNQFFTADERLEFCASLAISMIKAGKVFVTKEELLLVMSRTRFEHRTSEQVATRLEEALTDIQVCTFLSWGTGVSTFQFTHASILEFFAAKRIMQDCCESVQAIFAYSKQIYSRAIYRFLGEFLNIDGTFQDIIISASAGLPKSSIAARSFVCTIIMASGKYWNNISFTDVEIGNIDVERVRIQKSNLTGAQIQAVTFANMNFACCKLTACKGSSVTLRCVNFEKKSSFDFSGRDLKIIDCSAEHSDLRVTGRDWYIEGLVLRSSEITLGGVGQLFRVQCVGRSVIHLEDDFAPIVRDSLSFEDAIIIADWTSSFSLFATSISVTRCTLLLLKVPSIVLEAPDVDRLATGLRSLFAGSHGLVIVDDMDRSVDSKRYAIANQAVKGLQFVSIAVMRNINNFFSSGRELDSDEDAVLQQIRTLGAPYQRHFGTASLLRRICN
ncbi:putative NTPase (NACHT family) [Agrobacterium rosae]|uniref:Putative NTPase (NACHT family) n=2 Tax=Agrobacterium rosae TaxID=1972867 RepID=A0A1R3U5S4_9HYPH|nr:putative NTPase (NACHT family) [Agrobacterium rosae]